jgi:signal peptidase I
MIKKKHKRIVILALQLLFLMMAIFYLIYRPLFITKVVGISMEPTYKEGQLVLAYSLDKNYYLKDVVLIKRDSEILIKRVAYLPGQKFVCADLGFRRFVPIPPMKDVKQQLKYLNSHGVHVFIMEIPKNHVFVIGDNESHSEDSRVFGPVPFEDIIAKVIEN